MAGSDLAEQAVKTVVENIGNASMASGRRQHFGLYTAFPSTQVDLGNQCLHENIDIRVVEHHGQRCRAALIVGLCVEWHVFDHGLAWQCLFGGGCQTWSGGTTSDQQQAEGY